MSEKKRTYIPCIPDELVAAVGMDAAALACKLASFEKDGEIRVSLDYIATLWNKDVRSLRSAAAKLSALDIWQCVKSGNGRGHISEWKKGANFAPFMGVERVQNLQIKGAKNAPNNINNNIDRLISAHTRTKSINQNLSSINAGDTPAPRINMEQFEQFWKAFFFGSYAKYESEQMSYKDRAEAAWQYMSDQNRERILREIKAGKRYDKTHWVLWYIQNYKPLPPIWYAGDPELTAEMVGSLQVVKIKNRVAYCKPEDLQAWKNAGAKTF